MNERRRHRRIPFSRAVNVSGTTCRSCVLEAEDISLAGMRLYSERPVQLGETLNLHFYVMPRGEPQEMNMQGLVRHVGLEKDGYSFGVDFI
jgi:hypothetical protein